MKKALSVVPKKEWQLTPVSLRATAGLRLLPNSLADNIIEEVIKSIDYIIIGNCLIDNHIYLTENRYF